MRIVCEFRGCGSWGGRDLGCWDLELIVCGSGKAGTRYRFSN